MSTSYFIATTTPDDSIRYIYCNWNGEPSDGGRILAQHYRKQRKIDSLMNLGNLSFLGERIGHRTDYHNPADGQCLAYTRDRREDSAVNVAITVPTREHYLATMHKEKVNYAYLWNGTCWEITSVSPQGFDNVPEEDQLRWFQPGLWQPLALILTLIDGDQPHTPPHPNQLQLFPIPQA